jgi:hypothetical protein
MAAAVPPSRPHGTTSVAFLRHCHPWPKGRLAASRTTAPNCVGKSVSQRWHRHCSMGVVQPYTRAARPLVVAVLCVAIAYLTSCQSNDSHRVQLVQGPELDVALSTDLAIPADLDSIRIERWLPEISTRSISTEEHELGPTGLELPAILYFSGLSQPAFDRSVGIRVIAWKGGTPVVFAEALFTMADAGAAVVPLVLEASCKGQLKMLADASLVSSCPSLQTCRAGQCESIDRRSESIQVIEGAAGAAGAAGDAQAGSSAGSNP